MYDASLTLANFDPELADAIQNEEHRQEHHVELIASENYASPLVMAIQNSVFTNKYAEGYPGRRYYSGCENVDVAEHLAIERVKALHGVAILYDCHSIRSHIPFLFEGELPDFNIGTDMGRTCDPRIEAAAVASEAARL